MLAKSFRQTGSGASGIQTVLHGQCQLKYGMSGADETETWQHKSNSVFTLQIDLYKGSIHFDLVRSGAPVYAVFKHGDETVP